MFVIVVIARGTPYLAHVGMFDWYEPQPPLSCPGCAGALTQWQGKDGECALWVWRQGEALPRAQRVDSPLRPHSSSARLPARFEIYTTCSCGQHLDALGEAPDGVWTRTTLITAPVMPSRGPTGGWSCPCCGSFTLLEEPPGSYEICPVCWWEDDYVQFHDPDYAGGANTPCLRSARLEYLRSGVADPEHRARVRAARVSEMPE